jgi:hypothetical protein
MQLLNDGRIVMFGGMTVKDGEVPQVCNLSMFRSWISFDDYIFIHRLLSILFPFIQYHNDFRQLDTEKMVWSKSRINAELLPSVRYNHSFTQLGSQMVLLLFKLLFVNFLNLMC